MNESNLSDASLAELLTLTVEVNQRGNIRYRNHLGQMHRVHGPAVITLSGTRYWYQNNQLHRIHGPAIETETDGYKRWFLNGEHLTEEEWNERVKSL